MDSGLVCFIFKKFMKIYGGCVKSQNFLGLLFILSLSSCVGRDLFAASRWIQPLGDGEPLFKIDDNETLFEIIDEKSFSSRTDVHTGSLFPSQNTLNEDPDELLKAFIDNPDNWTGNVSSYQPTMSAIQQEDIGSDDEKKNNDDVFLRPIQLRDETSVLSLGDILQRDVLQFAPDKLSDLLASFPDVADSRVVRATLCPNLENNAQVLWVTQRKVVEDGTKVLLVGDLHGDLDCFLNNPNKQFSVLRSILNDWYKKGYIDANMKLADNCLAIFLGDYVDRGGNGLGVIMTLMQLYINNAEKGNVVLLRGNHEDIGQNVNGGFLAEINSKLVILSSSSMVFLGHINDFFYNRLPVALYLGDVRGSFIRCNHGGEHPAYNPKNLIRADKKIEFDSLCNPNSYFKKDEVLPSLTVDKDSDILKHMPWSPNEFRDIGQLGFLWADYRLTEEGKTMRDGNSCRIAYSCQDVASMLKLSGLRGVLRAHQHAGMDLPATGGFFALWNSDNTKDAVTFTDGMVGTCFPLCGNKVTHVQAPAYATLSIDGAFDDGGWKIEKVRVDEKNQIFLQ